MQIKYFWFGVMFFSLVIGLNCNAEEPLSDTDICPTCSAAGKLNADKDKKPQVQADASQTDPNLVPSATDASKDSGDDHVNSTDSPDES